MTTISSIPNDALIQFFYLLDLPSHVAASRVCKLFHQISLQPASQNPEMRLARAFHAVPAFSCVFTSEKNKPGCMDDEPQFMGRIVGNFLALLPFPAARRKANTLSLFSLSGPKTNKFFQLNGPIETCISVTSPEPALIVANKTNAVRIRMVKLQELIEKNSSELNLSELTELDVNPANSLTYAPNVIYFDNQKMAHELKCADVSPVVCVQGDLLAFAYHDSIKIVDRNDPRNAQTLAFFFCRKLSIQDGQLIALSWDKCALWRLGKVGNIDNCPFFEVERSEQEPKFKFVKVFNGKAAIAYWNCKETETTRTFGALHDLKTKQRADLVELKCLTGKPVLNHIICVGDSRLVGAGKQFMSWEIPSDQVSSLCGKTEVGDQCDAAVHTMIKIDCYVLSASLGPEGLRLHSEKNFNKSTNLWKKFGLTEKDSVLSFEIADRYALMEVRYQNKPEVKHSLKVFDLLGA